MKYLLIICCATEEEIYSYIYPINVQLKGTQRYLARGRTSYPIFLFYYLFIIFLFFDVTPNDTRPSATITNRQLWNSSLEESASCARAHVKCTGAPENDREKKLRTRRAIIYRGWTLFFPSPPSSLAGSRQALWQKFKGRRVIARAGSLIDRWSSGTRRQR